MAELIKFEIRRLPKVLIVGKAIRYSDEALNNGDNRLPGFWDKCYNEYNFAPLEVQNEYCFDIAHVGVFLDWYLGDGDFSYIVGMLMKEGVTVPGGYFVRALAETDVAVCWIKCKSLTQTRTVPFDSVAEAIKKAGHDCAGMKWCIDLYNRPRSTEPDENGDVILDCYIPLD